MRSAAVTQPDFEDGLGTPYSLTVLPELGMAVSTANVMGFPPWEDWMKDPSSHVQIWSLDPLELVSHVDLPEPEQGPYQNFPAEPRLLADGSLYVSTFACGLYRIEGLDEGEPKATFLHAFAFAGDPVVTWCAVPVVYGRFWVQTVTVPTPGLIVLDTSNPAEPIEVARLDFDQRYELPHWLAADRQSGRLVVTAEDASWVLVVRLDERTGALEIDESFRDADGEAAGISFDRLQWPHGSAGAAIVHGALFGH